MDGVEGTHIPLSIRRFLFAVGRTANAALVQTTMRPWSGTGAARRPAGLPRIVVVLPYPRALPVAVHPVFVCVQPVDVIDQIFTRKWNVTQCNGPLKRW